MRNPIHPDTGRTGTRARNSLLNVLVVVVALGASINCLAGLLLAAHPDAWWWWVSIMLVFLLVILLTLRVIIWDDRRIGSSETNMEWLVCYKISKSGRIFPVIRKSYKVNNEVLSAWSTRWKKSGFQFPEQEKKSFTQQIAREHLDLLRFLLWIYLDRYGKITDKKKFIHSWQRNLPKMFSLERRQWPIVILENPFMMPLPDQPESVDLPENSTVEVFNEGNIILRIDWQPCKIKRLYKSKFIRPLLPAGEICIHWLGPLDELPSYDKGFEMMTAHLPQPVKPEQVKVVITRLKVEIRTHWNFWNPTTQFFDWGVNFAHRLVNHMDALEWRRYLLENTILRIDQKIGYVKAGQPGIHQRLIRLDDRLARLENRLWPDEPPEDLDSPNIIH